MKRSEIITVLDIGSTKVCCCIANIVDDEHFDIIGVGHCVCFGVKSGIIVDTDLVELAIVKAVEQAEKMASFRIKFVYVNISGKNVQSEIVNISANIGGRIIEERDLMNMLSSCDAKKLEREIIHAIPIHYSIDSLNGIRNPVGMIASNLDVNVNLVTVDKIQLNNLLLCLTRCHLDPVEIVSSIYSSGLCVMDKNNLSADQIVIDFGGGTTSIGFFYNGIFSGMEVIPIGGKNITDDISYGLNISTSNAERLKTLHGSAFVSISDATDVIFVPVAENDDIINLQRTSKSSLNQIIQPRVEEILHMIKRRIDSSIFKNFSNNIIITGGNSMLIGIEELANEVLNKKIKIKKIDNFIDKSDIEINNNFSSAIGMIKFAQLNSSCHVKAKSLEKNYQKCGFFKKTLMWIENNL